MELVTKDVILRCYDKHELVSQIHRLGNDSVMSVSLVDVTMDEDEHVDLLGVQALLRCGNLIDVNLDGATFSLFMIRSLAQSCPKIRSLSLCAITDPDDGSSLLALATSGALETLNVSCWFELSNSSVLHLVSGCVSLRSMVVSHCKDLTISANEASSRRP